MEGRDADTLVSGATTYCGFVSYWPSVTDDPAQPEVERAISRRHEELEHLVISDSVTAEETGPWRERTRIVRGDEARDNRSVTCAVLAREISRHGGPVRGLGRGG